MRLVSCLVVSLLVHGCAAEPDLDEPGFDGPEDMTPLDDGSGSGIDTPEPEDPAAPPLAGPGPDAVHVTLDLAHRHRIAPVSKLLAGVNHRWVNRGFGVLRHDGTIDPQVVAGATGAGVGLLRYPAGTMANLWSLASATSAAPGGCQVVAGRDLVGDHWVFTNHGEDTTPYSPVAHMQFAAEIGAATNVMVPFINGTPRSAASFVEYMNAPLDGSNPNGGVDWAAVRAANGHPAPYHIKHWELGNEPYFANQRYWLSSNLATARHQYIHGDHTTRVTDQPLAVGCDYATPATGAGTPGQELRIWYPPVKAVTVKVGATVWHPVADLATAAAGDRVFALDAEHGTVTFGDGTHGAIPPAGARLAVSYTLDHAGFGELAAAMKRVDPSIDVCSAWGRPGFDADMAGAPYDCVATHVYTILSDSEVPSEPAALYRTLMAGEDEHGAALAALVADTRATRSPGAPYVEVTESGFLMHDGPVPYPEATQMHALYTVSLFTRFLELGLPLAQAGDLTSTSMRSLLSRDGGTWVTSVNALALRVFAGLLDAGGHAVSSTLSPQPTIGGATPFAMLRVATTIDAAGRLNILVANRDLHRDAVFDVTGFAGSGSGHAWTIEAAPFEANTAAQPDAIRIHQFSITPARRTYTVKAHSIARLRLDP